MVSAAPTIRPDRATTRCKLTFVAFFVLFFGAITFFVPASVTADEDKVVTEIASYRSWKKITKKPIAVTSPSISPGPDGSDRSGGFTVNFELPGGGWTFALDGAEVLSGPESRNKDLVTIIRSLGKDIGSMFSGKKQRIVQVASSTAATELSQPETNASEHGTTYGVVYANELAAAEIDKLDPKFPPGSVIVRERLADPTASVPIAVIAMVKRAEGTSKATGDWEFFILNEIDLKLMSKQTVGQCADCHSKTQTTDWVFRGHLK